jgi:molybdate-binding protein/DNA-binding transcriptional regulator YhcF (GntR family)
MMLLQIDLSLNIPVYAQIVGEIKRLIATGELHSGEKLPSVRSLAKLLDINHNTVLKSYSLLAKEGIVTSRPGEGTLIAPKDIRHAVLLEREQRLSSIINKSMLEALSSGFSLEDIDVAFHLQLARWKEESRNLAKLSDDLPEQCELNRISIIGSHDLALDILVSQFKNRKPDVTIELINVGSISGLIALQERKAQMAGIHLLDEETGEYNYAYVKHIFPGHEMIMLHLAYRIQGLIFASNNPKGIKSTKDLAREDLVFINRQKGSGTRLLLDFEIRRLGIQPTSIHGYEKEVDTHIAVARCIAQGEADAGLGIQAAARSYSLGFLPLFRERFDLVTYANTYHSPIMAPVIDIINSNDFKVAVGNLGGYDTSQTGKISSC